MSRITLAVLTVAAFLYAAWLVFLRKPLPDPGRTTGLRKRFLLAVLLFAGLLGASVSRADDQAPRIMCYQVVAPDAKPVRMTRAEAVSTLRAAWRTLDKKNGSEFRRKLNTAVEQGGIRQKVAAMLRVTFDELAYHKKRTRDGRMCYEMPPFGATLYASRENMLKQLELLEEARKKSTIDEETANKARAALAKELEMLHRGTGPDKPGSPEEERLLVKKYADGEITPSEEAKDAARIIVEMEKGEPAE